MAFDVVNEMIAGNNRKEALVKDAFERFAADQVRIDAFLSSRFKDAGNKTPLELAEASEAGLNTARCLLKPVSGC